MADMGWATSPYQHSILGLCDELRTLLNTAMPFQALDNAYSLQCLVGMAASMAEDMLTAFQEAVAALSDALTAKNQHVKPYAKAAINQTVRNARSRLETAVKDRQTDRIQAGGVLIAAWASLAQAQCDQVMAHAH